MNADKVALPAFAHHTSAEQQSNDISSVQGPQQQTYSSGWIGQTDQ